jgi:hypothetical protein
MDTCNPLHLNPNHVKISEGQIAFGTLCEPTGERPLESRVGTGKVIALVALIGLILAVYIYTTGTGNTGGVGLFIVSATVLAISLGYAGSAGSSQHRKLEYIKVTPRGFDFQFSFIPEVNSTVKTEFEHVDWNGIVDVTVKKSSDDGGDIFNLEINLLTTCASKSRKVIVSGLFCGYGNIVEPTRWMGSALALRPL